VDVDVDVDVVVVVAIRRKGVRGLGQRSCVLDRVQTLAS
jgi:hypothetical protein